MAFASFGNVGGATSTGGGGISIQNGPDLDDIQTEALGFLAISGDAKVQLLPSPWPADSLPPPTASLMSIASQKGLIAAVGPDCVIVATTESVRKAFEGPNSGDGNFKSFQPQLNLAMPMRISQLAFSADESYLVLAAEVGGGLAVYEVQSLLNGSTQMAFQLPTNGQPLRALVPNPTPEKGELFAVVTADGHLMMANLNTRNFVQGPSGQILKDGVSCISWSAKGKQLVAGLGNGTAFQMTPEGIPKGDIPKPPGMDDGHHISSITWLENNVFLTIYTPSNFDTGMAPSAVFNIVTRQPPSSFVFQKISEPVGPFGLNRSPPHHFILRLRDFPPSLQDILLVSSTASTDIGLFSRSKSPLAKDSPTGVFTMTELSDDSRRAQLPLAGLNDTSPIGFALDLSSKQKVPKPIPKDEIDESPTPLPALMVLNNDGVLASWWIVYSDSIRQGTMYPNLAIAGGIPQSSPAPNKPLVPVTSEPPRSVFGVSPSSGPVPGFGAASSIGQRQSPWGAPSATSSNASTAIGFGKPSFGSSPGPSASAPSFSTSAFGAASTPAFGSSGFSTNKPSLWGSAAPTNPAFGQATVIGKPASPFAAAAPSSGISAPTSGGFASFASQGGFSSAKTAPSGSIFGGKPATSIFGGSGQPANNNTASFGNGGKIEMPTDGSFGKASGPFVLGSTFKADGSAKNDLPTPSNNGKGSLFGGGFSLSLGEASNPEAPEPPVSKDADMDTTGDTTEIDETLKPTSTTPVSTPAPTKSLFLPTNPNSSGSLFGTGNSAVSTSTAGTAPTSTKFSFGGPTTEKTISGGLNFSKLNSTPSEKPDIRPAQTLVVSRTPPSPAIKREPELDVENMIPAIKTPEAPLPPDATSKSTFSAGDTSSSSIGTDAPLPPDFIPVAEPGPKGAAIKPENKDTSNDISAQIISPSDVPGGPEDEGDGSDFLTEDDGEEIDGSEENEVPSENEEGSGEDVAQDISPTSEVHQTPAFTPQSSFGGFRNRGSDTSHFTKIDQPTQGSQPRSLFGEIERSAPLLPPPNLQTSPRSPSPVRTAVPRRILRPETSRSVSAPGVASQILVTPQPIQSNFARQLEEQKAEERRKAEVKARKEAEESQALIDDHDDQLQVYLSSDLEPTRTLDEFVAHVEISNKTSADSIPAQVETVYRDINSMIDTLGVNARALKCFIKGHTEQYKDGGRGKEDLEDVEDWCLVELEDLSSMIEGDLTKELQDGQVKEVASKLETCNNLQKDLIRLHARQDDIKKILVSHSDPDRLAVARSQPLSAEQTAQQHDVRRNFARFQKLLAEAEEGLTILKSKIVFQATSAGKSNGTTGPTVEAIMRTITKMTSMAEKKSGDIDVLEGQMRKLRFGSTASTGSRESSPFATPNRASLRNPGTSSTYGLFYTPDSIKDDRRGLQSSFMSSTGSFGRSSPPRKKISGYSIEEKMQLKSTLARKKDVTDRLKATLQKSGTKVRLMDDSDSS